MGQSMTEGTVSRWLKAVGASMKRHEPLLEISTDKVDAEVPSPAAGTLLEITVPEGETVEVGAVLARVGVAGAAAPAPTPQPRSEAVAEAAKPEPAQPATQPQTQALGPAA